MKQQYMMPLAILAAWLISGCLSAAEYTGKYKGFELSPDNGASHYAVRVKKKNVPSGLKHSYAVFFDVDMESDFVSRGIKTYLEYQPGKFAITASAVGRDKKLLARFTSCDLKNSKAPDFNSPCTYMLGLVDTNSDQVIRLNSKTTLELGHGSIWSQGGYVAREGYPIYGCHVGNPFSAADLNLDGIPELFVIGGVGDYWGPEEGGIVAMTSLYIFDTKSFSQPKKLFKVELSNEAYSPKDVFPGKSEYQSYSISKLGNDGVTKRAKPFEQGLRRYSKLYFKDFDENDKLDILVWQREYKARLNSDLVKGYQLADMKFKRYEESSTGYVEKSVDIKVAEQYLKDHDLTWRKGYPRDNLCIHSNRTDPLIDRFEDVRHNINDPVLVEK